MTHFYHFTLLDNFEGRISFSMNFSPLEPNSAAPSTTATAAFLALNPFSAFRGGGLGGVVGALSFRVCGEGDDG